MKKELPEDWKWVKLGEISQITYGKGLPTKNLQSEGFPVYGANGIIGLFERYLYEKSEVLISCRGAYSGKINMSPPKCYVTNNSLVVKIIDDACLDKKYLYHVLQTVNKAKLVTGTAQPQVTINNAVELNLPLPPLKLQLAIVSKIEELFSELDKGIENLKTAQEQLKIYRQSVLKWAFEGKLTNGLNPDSLDLPEEHDLAMVAEPQEIYGKGKRGGNQENPKNQGVDKGGLPEGWKWVKLKDITALISDGDHQAPPKSDLGVPFITISNVDKQTNKIDFSKTFLVTEEYYYNLKDNRKPLIGDILYTVTGSFGIPILIDFDKEFCFQRHIGLIRPLNSTNQIWLYYLLQSPQIFNQAKESATGTAQKTVALSSLRNFEASYCSLAEQIKIVQEIESRLSVADKMEETIQQSLLQAESLRQSILKKAFEGELVK